MCHPPLSLCLVFYGLVLADGFTVFHGHLGLVGTHLFALPKIAGKKPHETSGNFNHKSNTWLGNWGFSLAIQIHVYICIYMYMCVGMCVFSLSPFMDEFELHDLLFLDSGQEFLEVFTLLCDVAVLYLLLLTAVTTDQL